MNRAARPVARHCVAARRAVQRRCLRCGLVVQSLLALWLFQAFGLSVGETAKIFFATNLLSAISYLIAARIAARIGLINTMVFRICRPTSV